VLAEFFAEHQGQAFSGVQTRSGTTSFLRWRKGDVNGFLARLRSEYETSVVPGGFFEMPEHFRIGMGVNTAMFGEGLERIRLAAE
jgi:aspartate/methionine/tyrosine aminotransferase